LFHFYFTFFHFFLSFHFFILFSSFYIYHFIYFNLYISFYRFQFIYFVTFKCLSTRSQMFWSPITFQVVNKTCFLTWLKFLIAWRSIIFYKKRNLKIISVNWLLKKYKKILLLSKVKINFSNISAMRTHVNFVSRFIVLKYFRRILNFKNWFRR